GGPFQRPTATMKLGFSTRMPQRPTTVAPVIRFEMFDHARPPSVVSQSAESGRTWPAVTLRLPTQPWDSDANPTQRRGIPSGSFASRVQVAPRSGVPRPSPGAFTSQPFAASTNVMSSCRPRSGLSGEAASASQPSVGGGTLAVGVGADEGGAGVLDPPHPA